MADIDPSLVARRRKRGRRGFVRVAVLVRGEDAGLVRDVASALRDPERRAEVRTILRERIAGTRAGGLKALLASAPLEDIELGRRRDFGRDVVLPDS